MSRHRHNGCCHMAYGAYSGYGVYGGNVGYGGYGGYGCGFSWIYALLILIVIVLQFGRDNRERLGTSTLVTECDDGVLSTECRREPQAIDNSVLFIIIVFLLIACACCWGGYGGYGGYGPGYGGGYGRYGTFGAFGF